MADSPAATATSTIEPPSGLSVLLKAALPSLPVVNQLPGVRKASRDGFAGLMARSSDVDDDWSSNSSLSLPYSAIFR